MIFIDQYLKLKNAATPALIHTSSSLSEGISKNMTKLVEWPVVERVPLLDTPEARCFSTCRNKKMWLLDETYIELEEEVAKHTSEASNLVHSGGCRRTHAGSFLNDI